MQDYGIWSLLPPLVAIALALFTRQVFLSLILGIWVGWVILNQGNILTGSFDTIHAMVDVFSDPGNTRVIIFTFLVGALIALVQRSGGVDGFNNIVFAWLERKGSQASTASQRVRVELLAAVTGLLLFIESNISILTVGTLFRPITDKLVIPREKLAYIADSSSAPSCILIPLNAWGAYIMGLLLAQGIEQPFTVLLKSMVFNFYPILAIILLFTIIISRKDFGPMRRAEERASNSGKLLADGATPMISDEIASLKSKAGVSAKAINMVLPILTMVLLMPVFLIMTGWNSASGVSNTQHALAAISQGSGSTSVLFSVTFAILLAMVLYRVRGVMKTPELIETSLQGMSGMVRLALLMLLAFAIGSLCKQLGTGIYVAQLSAQWLSPALVPAVIFVVSGFIAFSTGTSWGTFAIMIAIAVPVAVEQQLNLSLVVAAAIGGGVFGDHCSPISDTTVISSMASASDHIDHVKTQLPYALVAGGGAVVLYLLVGLLSS